MPPSDSKAQRRKRLARALGVCLIVAGLGLDLLPGTRPGFHTLQILVILSGLALALLPSNAPRLTQQLRKRRGRDAAKVALISLATLVALEFALAAIGYQTYFPQDVPDTVLRPAPWWTCSDSLCHYVQDEMARACQSGQMSGRYCIVNAQGFHDSQDFAKPAAEVVGPRVLVLGDSFTFGEAADIGHSYVETIEALLPDALVWNTGIFGVGSDQELAAFEKFAPILQPDIAILGFYINDFFDNLFPVDGYLVAIDEAGEAHKLQQYHMDPWGNASKLDLHEILWYRWRGVEAPANDLERLLGGTRIGSLLVSAVDYVGKQVGLAQRTQEGRKVALTREYLRGLQAGASALGSQFLIMLIPSLPDLQKPGPEYQQAIKLFEDLEIAYFAPRDLLLAETDYAPDWHWSNAGHQKVGALLAECIAASYQAGSLAACDSVILP